LSRPSNFVEAKLDGRVKPGHGEVGLVVRTLERPLLAVFLDNTRCDDVIAFAEFKFSAHPHRHTHFLRGNQLAMNNTGFTGAHLVAAIHSLNKKARAYGSTGSEKYRPVVTEERPFSPAHF